MPSGVSLSSPPKFVWQKMHYQLLKEFYMTSLSLPNSEIKTEFLVLGFAVTI
jgi:hypothetical protein